MSDYDRLIQESLERENSLIACELNFERDCIKSLLLTLQFIARRAAQGAKYGPDMHSSAKVALEDIEQLALKSINTHLNKSKGTP